MKIWENKKKSKIFQWLYLFYLLFSLKNAAENIKYLSYLVLQIDYMCNIKYYPYLHKAAWIKF